MEKISAGVGVWTVRLLAISALSAWISFHPSIERMVGEPLIAMVPLIGPFIDASYYISVSLILVGLAMLSFAIRVRRRPRLT